MVVVGKPPHDRRSRPRKIGRVGAVERGDERVQAGPRGGDELVDGIVYRLLLAGPLGPGQAPIAELADLAGADALEPAGLGDHRFEGELRRPAAPDLPGRRHRPGLVVDDGQRSVGAAVDAIGDGGNRERRPVDGQRERALDFRSQRRGADAAGAFVIDEPACDALQARPPEGGDAGVDARLRKRCLAEGQQPLHRVVGQRTRMSCDEAIEHIVDDDPAAGGIRRGIETLQPAQAQDLASVDGVGVAHPGFDPRRRHPARPGRRRRRRCGRRARRDAGRPVDPPGPALGRAVHRRPPGKPGAAREGRQPQEPARRHGRCPGDLRRAAEHHVGAAAAWQKSWADWPMRRSGDDKPRAARICRLSHGSAAGSGGQVPSLRLPRMTRSGASRRASRVPRMARRGWLPQAGRTTWPRSSDSSRAG